MSFQMLKVSFGELHESTIKHAAVKLFSRIIEYQYSIKMLSKTFKVNYKVFVYRCKISNVFGLAILGVST